MLSQFTAKEISQFQDITAQLNLPTEPENRTLYPESSKHMPKDINTKWISIFTFAKEKPQHHLKNEHLDNLENLVDELDEHFQVLWKDFYPKGVLPKRNKIKVYRLKQKAIEESDLAAFVQETISLYNKLQTLILVSEQYDFYKLITQHTLSLFDNWLNDCDTLDITKNLVSQTIVSFLLKNSLIMTDIISKQAFKSSDTDEVISIYEEMAGLVSLQKQYSKELESRFDLDMSLYKRQIYVSLVDIFGFWRNFDRASHYAQKLCKDMENSKSVTCSQISPLIQLSDHYAQGKNPNLQQAIYWMGKALKFLNRPQQTATEEVDEDINAFRDLVRNRHNEIKGTYYNAVSQQLKSAQGCGHIEDSNIVFTFGSQQQAKIKLKSLQKSRQTIIQRLSQSLKLNQNSLQLSLETTMTTKELNQLLSHIQPKEEKPKQVPQIQSKSQDIDHLSENFSKLNLKPELQTCEKKPNQAPVSKSSTDLDYKEPITKPAESNPPSSLVVHETPNVPSEESLFESVMVNKAHGLFIAYQYPFALSKKSNDNPTLQKRFKELCDHATKVGPKNENGFKYIYKGNEAILVGKITRLPYRLFPCDKKVNQATGETTFYFGEIRDTKHGKKANRY